MKYSSDKNALIILSLLKSNGIRKVIASPGTTNIALVGSMQNDDYFELFSSVDERSAAYMACGLAAESGEPVVIVCTEATASRNYLPGLTEAFYRKLPILVIAGTHGEQYVGHLHSQVIDRSSSPKDTVVNRFFLKKNHNSLDEWENVMNANKAFDSLRRNGGGPVLMNVVMSAGKSFDVTELPKVKNIRCIRDEKDFPVLPSGRIAIFVGSHTPMSKDETKIIDDFCGTNDAVVFCDHTSGYRGRYEVNYSLVCCQKNCDSVLLKPNLLIHIGEVSGDTFSTKMLTPQHVWRVSEDGEMRDLFKTLDIVFEKNETTFFKEYSNGGTKTDYLTQCESLYKDIYDKIPELEFGNIFIAQYGSKNLPSDSVVHFSIFNSLRSWSFFPLNKTITSSCNVGGFGIDGAISTCLGASLANKSIIHFLIIGDLAFFYDINALGNRHVQNNLRILLINNGRGVEFKKKDHPGYRFGDSADLFIAAGGHYGNMSKTLVRHYAEDLGFEYLSASNKEEFLEKAPLFFSSKSQDKPILFEAFIDEKCDVENLDKIRHINGENDKANRKRIVAKFGNIIKNLVQRVK